MCCHRERVSTVEGQAKLAGESHREPVTGAAGENFVQLQLFKKEMNFLAEVVKVLLLEGIGNKD